MKKIMSALLIAVVLSILTTMFVPFSAGASGSTVATGLATSGFAYPNLLKTFWADGYEYIWYFKSDNNIAYKSGNGTVFGAEHVVRAAVNQQWSVNSDGNYISYVYAAGSGGYSHLYWRMGQALGNGSVSWLAAEQDLGAITTGGGCYAGWDSAGNPWIFYNASSTYTAIKNDHLDGTWHTATGFPITIKAYQYNGAAYKIGMYDVGGGGMVFLYSDAYNERVHAKCWNGSSLSNEVSASSLMSTPEITDSDIMGIAINERVAVVFVNGSNNLQYVEYDSLTNTFGTEMTLQTGFTQYHNGVALGKDYSTANLYVWWENVPVANHMYQRYKDLYGTSWSDRLDVFTSSGFGGSYGGEISANAVSYGTVAVSYTEPSGTLKCYPAQYTSGAPFATANAASDVTATSATLSAYVNWDGASAVCTMEFFWGGGGQLGNYTVPGYVHSLDTKTHALTGLVPDNVYSYWVVITNEHGTYYSNLQQFLTLPGAEPTTPIVTTMTPSHVSDTSVQVNGHLNYDGATGNGAWVGFQLRIHGTSEWVDSFWNCSSNAWGDCVNYHVFYTNEDFSGTLTGLQAHTTYDVRAHAKNGMNAPGTASYGDILTFTTGVIPGATITPSPYPLLPPNLIPGLNLNLSPNGKIFLALLVIVATMIGVGLILYKVPLVAGICAIADGVVWLVAFSIWGWLPGWVLLALIVILGMLILLIVLAKR